MRYQYDYLMGVFSIAELLKVDAASITWDMQVGNQDPAQGPVAGPAVAEGDGGVGGADTFTTESAAPIMMSALTSDTGLLDGEGQPAEQDKILATAMTEDTKKMVSSVRRNAEAARYAVRGVTGGSGGGSAV